MPRPAATPSSGFLVALAVLLALVHAILAVTATAEKSMTSDEIAHLTAGHAYNTLGDYRLQPENGNLPQRWAALPLTVAGAPLPPTSRPLWRDADVWRYGHAFFYEQPLTSKTFLFAGRAMIALFSAATGLLIFFWSRARFGWRGAFLSLTLFAFCPAFLAHGALATSDIVMTFFFLAAVGAWWRHLEKPGAAGAALSAGVLGLACVAKFSAVLLAPMLALSALVWLAGRVRADGWRVSLTRLARTSALHFAAAWAIIWLFYGFRFSAFTPTLADGANFNHGWGWMLQDMGWPRGVFLKLREWRALPDAFLYGFAFVLQFAQQRGAFLNGDYSITGWVSFFPYAFLVKTTLPFLLLVLVGAIADGRRQWAEGGRATLARLRPFTPLIGLFAVYWATSLTSHLNIGHRHILPTYPVLFIAAGAFGAWLDFRRPFAALLVAVLALWHAGESWLIRPHYLAYFNALAGGPANGWRHLVDSSLDWGQDLPALRTWLDAHAPGEKVFLSYFGTGDPAHEGIRATMLPTLPEVGPPRPWRPLTAGVYGVSATMLQQVYSPVRGDWTLEREAEYQKLRTLEPLLLAYQGDPVRRAELLRDAPAANWTTAWKRYELLRLARLCHYLRVRPPEANAGYSILIYRLTAEEIAAATAGSIREWSALIERAAARRG
ncbi:MAG: hypothetical protein EXS32_12465 [Opitutus sp.]|nr:hypothetical protein [Opitutus sp.]